MCFSAAAATFSPTFTAAASSSPPPADPVGALEDHVREAPEGDHGISNSLMYRLQRLPLGFTVVGKGFQRPFNAQYRINQVCSLLAPVFF